MSVNQIWPTMAIAMINATFLNMILIQELVACFQHCKTSALIVSVTMIALCMRARRPYHCLLQIQTQFQLRCQVMLKVESIFFRINFFKPISVTECLNENPMPADVPYIDDGCTNGWPGDGICDDVCNVPEHQFDGGDCCLDLLVGNWCSFCFCYQDCSFHNISENPDEGIPGPPAPPFPPAPPPPEFDL